MVAVIPSLSHSPPTPQRARKPSVLPRRPSSSSGAESSPTSPPRASPTDSAGSSTSSFFAASPALVHAGLGLLSVPSSPVLLASPSSPPSPTEELQMQSARRPSASGLSSSTSPSTRKKSSSFLRRMRSFGSVPLVVANVETGEPLPPPIITASPPQVFSEQPRSQSPDQEQEEGMPGPDAVHWLLQPVPGTVPVKKSKGKERELVVVDSSEQEEEGGRRRKSSLMSRRSTFSLFRKADPPLSASGNTPAASSTTSTNGLLKVENSHAAEVPPPQPPEGGAPTLPSLQLSPYRMSWAFDGASSSSTTTLPSSTPPTPSSAQSRPLSRRISISGSLTPPLPAGDESLRPSATRQRSNSTISTSQYRPSSRSTSPLKVPLSASIPASDSQSRLSMSLGGASRRRPTTSGSDTSYSAGGGKGMFSAVSGFFGGGGSGGASSASMSRNSSTSSLGHTFGPDENGLAPVTANVATSEFGALFDKSPSKRKRGLSLGATALFGSGSSSSANRKRAGSNSSLVNSWGPPPLSVNTGTGMLTPGLEDLPLPPVLPVSSGPPTPNRSRASTDAKRLSFSSNASSSASYPLPPPGRGALSPPPSPTLTRQSSSVHLGRATSPAGAGGRKSSLSITDRPRRPRATSTTSIPAGVDESPSSYVERLVSTVSKSDITRILASSSTPFHLSALTAYLSTFDFHSDPLDVALRKFLMEAALPTETQQIDRVMEAFAIRYDQCNPGLWDSSDTPYVLAFSMVMLSTDQFNPSNKNKMTKSAYVKNANIEGVAVEVLEYFFDQITITPFVFVEDDDGPLRPELQQSSSSSFFGKSTSAKIDPYHLIADGLTRDLRVDVEALIPTRSPFSFTGTTAFFNATTLHLAFAHAPILQVSAHRNPTKSSSGPSPFATVPAFNGPFPSAVVAPSASISTEGVPLTPVQSNMTYAPPPPSAQKRDGSAAGMTSLKVTKIGVLSRKEDLAEGGRKSNSRKWKGWSVVLTGSQLLFFKETTVASSLQQALAAATSSQNPSDEGQNVAFSISMAFKPDAVLSLADTAAIYDATYKKYQHVFRLVAPAGRQYLFQARDADDLNSWLAHINYAASFKTAGLRIRGLPPRRNTPSHSGSGSPISNTFGAPPSPRSPNLTPRMSSLGSSVSSKGSAGSDALLAPPLPADSPAPHSPQKQEEEGIETLAVTADLPASLVDALRASTASTNSITSTSTVRGDEATPLAKLGPDYGFPVVAEKGSLSPGVEAAAFDRAPVTRAEVLRDKITQLELEIETAKAGLHADLRLVRNLAVLTPFRTSTRERIVVAVRKIEERVRHVRMTLARLVCHREVLARDLLVEDREAQRARKVSHGRVASISRHGSLRSSANHPPSTLSPRGSLRGSRSSPGSPRPLGHRSQSSEASLEPSQYHDAEEHLDGETEEEDDIGHSLTDDELDRLRSPPLMQRSTTETLLPGRLRAASSATSDDDLELNGVLRPNMSSASINTRRSSVASHEGMPTSTSTAAIPLITPPMPFSLPTPEESEEVAENWMQTKAGAAKRISLVDYERLDERGLNSLMRIREERRSEAGAGGSDGGGH